MHQTAASTINFVKANKSSKHKVTISFDEWNVWYRSHVQDKDILGGTKGWPHAPRLLEDIWRQTTYYPYHFTSIHGRGHALHLVVKCPSYDADVADNVPYSDITGVHNKEEGTLTFFAINRHENENLEVDLDLRGFGLASIIDHQALAHASLEAVNTLANPGNVTPVKGKNAKVNDGTVQLSLAPLSYQMLRIKLAA